MMVKEMTVVPTAALPLDAFREHLRLGTGFADTGAEDAILLAYLRAAIAAIEGRTAKVLLAREFSMELTDWRGRSQPLPMAPVSAVGAVRIVEADGEARTVAAGAYRLARDMARPRIEGVGGALPAIPYDGYAVVEFTAGFGASWNALPADLAQAVMLLAAQYYELRHDGAAEGSAMPFGVATLIERWRTVRVLGGRG